MSPQKKLAIIFISALSVLFANLATAHKTDYNKNTQDQVCGKKPAASPTGLGPTELDKFQGVIINYFKRKVYTKEFAKKEITLGDALSDNFLLAGQFLPGSSREFKIYSGTVYGGAFNDTILVTTKREKPVLVGFYRLGMRGLMLKGKNHFITQYAPTIVDVYYRSKKDLSALPLVEDLATSFSRFWYPASGFGHIKHYEIHLYNVTTLKGCKRVDGKVIMNGCYYKTIRVNALSQPCDK
jgi:hypothetical protein